MATASPSLGEQISEELTCSICLERFTRPKVLPCQHTFCQDCLQNHAGGEETFQCPNCRQQVDLPPQGVTGLPDNHIVANLCERFQGQATLSEETEETGNRCSFHPSEEVKLYCRQCNMPICNKCLDEAHSDHDTISLKKALQERKAPVQALIAEGRNILETGYNSLKRLENKDKNLKERKKHTDNSIIHAYNQMVQKLTERRDHLLSEVDKHHRHHIKVLQQDRNKVSADMNELSGICGQAEQEMEQGGHKFLRLGTSLSGVVQRCKGKAAPNFAWIQPASFHFTDTPIPELGHVMIPMTFGRQGSGTGQFDKPNGVTVSADGKIFVADRGNKRIQVFTLQGTFVQEFQRTRYGAQKIAIEPHDVAMDGEGNLWMVGNAGSANIAVQYNIQGSVVRHFGLQNTKWFRGVAVDTRKDLILITQISGEESSTKGEVLVFRPDGTLVRTVDQQQGMKMPLYITVDGGGNILVSDWGNNSVFVYNEDGRFQHKFEQYKQFLSHPRGICSDKAGTIFVADRGNSCVKQIQMLKKSQIKVKHIATDMFVPHAVAMGPNGQLVVTDICNHTLLIMQILY